MALMGTPSGLSNSGLRHGQLRAGAVKRLLGCAAFSGLCGVQGRPRQSMARAGGVLLSPSHQTVLSLRSSATFVKIVSLCVEMSALGFDFMEVPGATPKKPFSGFTAQSLPSLPTRSHAISSPTHQTRQPHRCRPSGGMSMARFVLPQAEGKAAEMYLISPRGFWMPRISMCSAIQPS